MKKTLLSECISEFIGSWILIFIGAGSVSTLILNGSSVSQWELSLVWGLSITMAMYITGSISGTHINPVVTITLAVYRGFPKDKIIPYILAQFLGCFAGAAASYICFKNLFLNYEKVNGIVRASFDGLKTACIFSTYPNAAISYSTAFLVETCITGVLIMVILAVIDPKNTIAPKANIAPIIIGLTIAMIGGSFGCLTGFALNPSRDLGPKLFAMLAGWGPYALGKEMYFLIPVVAPIVGGLIGGFIYEKGIGKYLEEHQEEKEEV